MSNLDLSTSVSQLLEHHENNQRQLETYLLSFWLLAAQYKNRTGIDANKFIELLGLAFTANIPAFQNEWRSPNFDLYADGDGSYLAFEETILEQIVDLREMDETGLLSNELRYFEIDSPRGNRWFNFDPTSYLECAAAGLDAYSRQASEDARTAVSEKDEYSGCQNSTLSSQMSWKQIKEFFWCGQIYE